jgi:hypothetical protein
MKTLGGVLAAPFQRRPNALRGERATYISILHSLTRLCENFSPNRVWKHFCRVREKIVGYAVIYRLRFTIFPTRRVFTQSVTLAATTEGLGCLEAEANGMF